MRAGSARTCLVLALVMLTVPVMAIGCDAEPISSDNDDISIPSEDATATLDQLFGGLSVFGDMKGRLPEAVGARIPTDFPSIEDIVEWINEEKKSEVIIIDKDLTVGSGEFFHIGYDNEYRLSEKITITIEEGATLGIGPNYTVLGSDVKFILMEGSKLSIFNNEYPIDEVVTVVINGTMGSEVRMEEDHSGTNTLVTLGMDVDINGSISINDSIYVKGAIYDEISLDMTVEIPPSGDAKAEAKLNVNFSSLTIDDGNEKISLGIIVIGLEGTMDPEKKEDHIVITGDVKADLEYTSGHGNDEFIIKFPMTSTLYISIPVDEGASDDDILFMAYIDAKGDLKASNNVYKLDCKDLTITAAVNVRYYDEELLFIPLITAKADDVSLKAVSSRNETDLHLDNLYLHYLANIPIMIDLETGEIWLDEDNMAVEYALSFTRVHGNLENEYDNGETKINALIDAREVKVVADADLKEKEKILMVKIERIYTRIYLGFSEYESVRIDAKDMNLSPSSEESSSVIDLDAAKFDLEAQVVNGKKAHLNMNDGSLTLDYTSESQRITVKKGDVSFSGGTLEADIQVTEGAKVHFDDFIYLGRMTLEGGASISGRITMPMLPDTSIDGAGISVSFKDYATAYLDLTIGERATIVPMIGYKLDQCPSGTDYVKYELNEDGTATASDLNGVFFVETSSKQYSLTIGETKEMHNVGETVILSDPGEEGSDRSFVGWYDGTEIFRNEYVMPSRDVVMKDIWSGKVTDKDIVIKWEVCAIKLDCNEITIDQFTFSTLKQMIDDGSIETVEITIAGCSFTIGAKIVAQWSGEFRMRVLISDASAMIDRSRSIGDGTVYQIEAEDDRGTVDLKDGITMTTELIGHRDKSMSLCAYYMDDGGRLHQVQCEHSDIGGKCIVTMHIQHLSDYVIKQVENRDTLELPFAIVISAILVTVSVVVLYLVTRK